MNIYWSHIYKPGTHLDSQITKMAHSLFLLHPTESRAVILNQFWNQKLHNFAEAFSKYILPGSNTSALEAMVWDGPLAGVFLKDSLSNSNIVSS